MPKLSRGQKTARNLIICLLLAVLLWDMEQFPLPTKEMNFRRLERYWGLSEGELVFREGDMFVDDGGDRAAVGEVHGRRMRRYSYTLRSCPLGEGIGPMALPDGGLLLFRVPEEADDVTFFLLNESGQAVKQAEGVWIASGLYRVSLEGGYEARTQYFSSHCPAEGWRYRLELWSERGGLNREQEGRVPFMDHWGWPGEELCQMDHQSGAGAYGGMDYG